MQTIGELLGKNLGKTLGTEKPEKKTRGGINSLRADNCGQLLVFMGEDKTLPEERELERQTPGAGKEAKRQRLNKRIKYWLGRTRKIPAGEIYALMKQAKEGARPQALFNWLIKNYGKEKSK